MQPAAEVLSAIDAYYRDRSDGDDSVLTVLVQRLAEPNPRDSRVTRQLTQYKGIAARWSDWAVVQAACGDLADALLDRTRDLGQQP